MLTRSLYASLLLLAATVAPGCGSDTDDPTNPDTTIRVQGYDQSCTTTADCVEVFVGSVCGCDCTQGAINASEIDRFNKEVNEKKAECNGVVSCVPCQDSPGPVCNTGQCTAQ